ncbi:MAG: hypothetical protein M1827_007299 [Pycnora praestabilis]|nr:MAG: hypothetical protein M1827_007299 [Pycnora praestabilis]
MENSPFKKLPFEIREKIYHYHLVFDKPIVPVLGHEIKTFMNHKAQCDHEHPSWKNNNMNDLVRSYRELVCKNDFSGEETTYLVPPSCLALLQVCKAIHDEAVQIFYRYNHFIFKNQQDMSPMKRFLDDIGNRYLYLGELEFRFHSGRAKPIFYKLAMCRYLKKLHIKMDIKDSCIRFTIRGTSSLKYAEGMLELRQLRGLKVLELVGTDQIESDKGPHKIDVNDKLAVGTWLRTHMTRRRVEEIEQERLDDIKRKKLVAIQLEKVKVERYAKEEELKHTEGLVEPKKAEALEKDVSKKVEIAGKPGIKQVDKVMEAVDAEEKKRAKAKKHCQINKEKKFRARERKRNEKAAALVTAAA